MKYLIISFIILLNICSYGQNNHNYVFYDACSDKVLELDCSILHYSEIDTNADIDSIINEIIYNTREVKAGEKVAFKKEGFYTISTIIESKVNHWISEFTFEITNNDKTNIIDTLYLRKLRYMWNRLLHPQEVAYYYCDSICNGKIKERDSNGIVRATGKFKKGQPISNVNFFDSKGRRELKMIYQNGNLKKIK